MDVGIVGHVADLDVGQGVEDDHGKLSNGVHPLLAHKEHFAGMLVEDGVAEGVVVVVVGGQVGGQKQGHFRSANTATHPSVLSNYTNQSSIQSLIDEKQNVLIMCHQFMHAAPTPRQETDLRKIVTLRECQY